jgi:hypothetical protein
LGCPPAAHGRPRRTAPSTPRNDSSRRKSKR